MRFVIEDGDVSDSTLALQGGPLEASSSSTTVMVRHGRHIRRRRGISGCLRVLIGVDKQKQRTENGVSVFGMKG